jgi:hypothetical protein
MHKRGLVAVALVGLLLAALAGPAAADQHRNGWIRAFHNSPDTPAVDIYVNGAKTLSGVTYGTVSDYLQVPKGRYTIDVKVAPSTADDAPALTRNVAVGARPVTVAAIGSLTGDGAALRLKAYRGWKHVRDSVSRVRVVHTSPDAPNVDVQVKIDGAYQTVISDLMFKQPSPYLRLNPGTYDFRVVATADPSVIVADLPGTQLPGGTAVSVWAVGFLTPEDGLPGFDVKITVD